MKKVLWLASWYPNRLDRFDGDFIQRHARAVALFCNVHVLYIKKDEMLPAGTTQTEQYKSGNLTEEIVYYNSAKTGIKLLDRLLSQEQYKKHFRTAINKYIQLLGKPELVHVHVAMKAGIVALWMKRKWNLPFIVTEHWTGYLKEADIQIGQYPVVYKNFYRKILDNATALTVVSDYLGRSMQQFFPEIKYQVIPNVVDTAIFYPLRKAVSEKVRFIHVSNMNYQKNTETILQALSLLKHRCSFEMSLYGPADNQLQEMVTELGLEHFVFVMGEQPYPEIAKAIQQSDALVLYSRFETFGCVLIEANACGVPVIVSELEVFHEIIEDGVNGFFAEGENPEALAEKLQYFIAHTDLFDKTKIAETTATKYNYEAIGKQFTTIYEKITAYSN